MSQEFSLTVNRAERNIILAALQESADRRNEIARELGVSLADLIPATPVVRPVERIEPAKRDLLFRAIPELASGNAS